MSTKFIEAPRFNSSPKEYVRDTMLLFLMEVMHNEHPDNWGFTEDPNNQGMRILAKFPDQPRELPAITCSMAGFKFAAVTNNRFVNGWMTDSIDNQLQDNSEKGNRQIYKYNAVLGLSVTSVNWKERDEIMDKLFNIFAWSNYKVAASLPLREYFLDRGMVLDLHELATAGDTEDVLPTGDLVHMDGMSIPLYGETYSPKTPNDRIESINFQTETNELT